MRPVLEAATLALLLLAGAVIERSRGGLELLYLCLPLVLLGPALRRLAAWRGRGEPAPRAVFALEIASFAGLVTKPFSPLGLGLAGLAGAATGLGGGPSPVSQRAETALVALLAAGAVVLSGARAASADPGALLALALAAVLLVETRAPKGARTSAAATRRAGAFSTLLAASLAHDFDAHLPPPHARDVLLAVAVLQAAIALAALAGHEPRLVLSRRHLGLGAFAALCAALELGARLVEPRLAPAYTPHPYTCYALDPAFPGHTRDGLREPSVARVKPAGTYRLALVGGSAGYEGDRAYDETWAAYLEEHLSRRFPGRRLEVLNAAVAGYNSCDTFARFHAKVLDYAPDLVLDCDGLDDVWPMLCGPVEGDLRNARRVMAGPGTFARLLRRSALVRFLGGRGPGIEALTYVPFVASEERYRADTRALRRSLEDLAFICRGRRLRLVLATSPLDAEAAGEPAATQVLRRAAADVNGAVRDVAVQLELPLLDLDRTMPRDAPSAAPGERYFSDARTATVRGDRVKANLAGDVIAPLVERDLGVKAEPFELDTAPAPGGAYPKARLAR